ncbi:MAG: UTP--glucose-1-phosphate uridylyltransferase GalU [Proteobacteria bacterium]|nr:UTP--glucose-1-phosphate uridylyltransferase GalU [Pseudomonadota bacterium]
MKKSVRKAVFPVGGLGTRFLPATKSMPKEMLPIANKPIIQYAFEEAKNAGIEEFIFINGRNKASITNHFDYAYELQSRLTEKQKLKELEQVAGWLPPAGNIFFTRQQKAMGLGHAVWCARNFVGDEPFAVILADEMMLDDGGFLKSMIDLYHDKGGCSVVSVNEVEKKDVDKYGIISTSAGSDKIEDMVEKPKAEDAPSNLAINGRYILSPEIFKYLENCEEGSGGEIQLTDAMKAMAKEHPFYYKKYEGVRFDCGNVLGYLEANIAYALENKELDKSAIKSILKKYI